MNGDSHGGRVPDGGSATVEAVGLLIPVLAACVLLLVFGFRLAASGQTLTAITASAARAASLQPDPTAGLASARAEANALTGAGPTSDGQRRCARVDVALDASAFRPGGTAVVTLTCTLTTRALTGIQVPGTLTRAITSRAPIDRYSSQVEG